MLIECESLHSSQRELIVQEADEVPLVVDVHLIRKECRRTNKTPLKLSVVVAFFFISCTSFVKSCQVELNVSSIIPKSTGNFFHIYFSTRKIQPRMKNRPQIGPNRWHT